MLYFGKKFWIVHEIPMKISQASNTQISARIATKIAEFGDLVLENCKSDRSRQELFDEYLVAKFGFLKRTERICLLACFDTAENESAEVCQN